MGFCTGIYPFRHLIMKMLIFLITSGVSYRIAVHFFNQSPTLTIKILHLREHGGSRCQPCQRTRDSTAYPGRSFHATRELIHKLEICTSPGSGIVSSMQMHTTLSMRMHGRESLKSLMQLACFDTVFSVSIARSIRRIGNEDCRLVLLLVV